jgi:poly(3-hydroxybutyrate) depolymerase
MKPLALALTAAVAVLAASCAQAEMLDKTGRFGGLTVQYKVLLPPNYDPAKAYPAVLVFTGGPQALNMAENTINSDWKAEAEKRGYIVISPAAPNGQLYYEGGDKAFPAFLDAIRKDYRIAGKLHVAGHSNGGLSAYHIAAKYPAYFSTVTGYPGLLNPDEIRRAPALKPLCLYMHAGDQDLGWPEAMQDQAETLGKQGYRIKFTLEPKQGHRLKSAEIDLSRRLFDEIESCK